MSLKDKVLLITGASRGIGLAIALKAAADGAKIAILAKTVTENPKLPGTIYTAAEAIKAAGGQAIAIPCDVRDEQQVMDAIAETVEAFGGIDIVVNNAGAIQLTNTEKTDMKRFDLMYGVNVRATYMVAKHALPHLKKSANPHILSLSPPLNLNAGWLAPHVAYTLSKYGMTMVTLGMAEEFKPYGIAVNSLWPETAVDTSAVRNLLGGEKTVQASRKPEIVADSAYWIFNQSSKTCTGNFFVDSQLLVAAGVTDLSKYAVDPAAKLMPDFFLGEPPKVIPPELLAGKGSAPTETKSGDGAAVAATKGGDSGAALAATKDGDSGAVVAATKAADSSVTSDPNAKAPYSAFKLTSEGGVAHITLSTPGRANCLTEAFWKEFPAAVAALADTRTRVLVVSGEGGNFSSGIDLAILADPTVTETRTPAQRNRLRQTVLDMQSAITALEDAPFVTIAMVDGLCLGGGLDLIAACDMRYGTKSAKFAIEEINIGLMADLGSLQRLPRIMNEGAVRDMTFTGRRVDGQFAYRNGLLGEVFDDAAALEAHVRSLAAEIASKAPSAVTASKQSLNFNHGHTVTESLAHAASLQAALFDGAAVRRNIDELKARLKTRSRKGAS